MVWLLKKGYSWLNGFILVYFEERPGRCFRLKKLSFEIDDWKRISNWLNGQKNILKVNKLILRAGYI